MERSAVVRTLASRSSLWVCASDDFTEAKTRMLDLTRQTGLKHFVHDYSFGNVVATSVDNSRVADNE